MSKKVIGALLALALVLSVFSFSVFAAGTGYDNDPSHTQTWGLANKTGSDGTYTVDVLLTTTYEVGPIQFKIEGVDEVTKVTVGSDYYAAVANAGKSGLVSIIPDTSTTVTAKKLSNAVVATVTYKSASNGTPSIKDDVKSASNPQGTLMASYAEGSDYLNGCDFLVGQKATIVPLGGEMPEPPAADADLQVKSGVTGVYVDKNKTFGGAYAGAVYGFKGVRFINTTFITDALEATDGSTLVINKGSKNYGTGATITVGDKTYVVVIFGDVNCDGLVNANDPTACKGAITDATKAPVDSPVRMAANCQVVSAAVMMHTINANDTTEVKKIVGGLDVSKIAEKHFATNNNYQ